MDLERQREDTDVFVLVLVYVYFSFGLSSFLFWSQFSFCLFRFWSLFVLYVILPVLWSFRFSILGVYLAAILASVDVNPLFFGGV